jgi:hypothetical protein
MFAIFKKEINAFFSSLIGYLVIGIFLLSTGLLMWFFPDTSLLEYRFARPIVLHCALGLDFLDSCGDDAQLRRRKTNGYDGVTRHTPVAGY